MSAIVTIAIPVYKRLNYLPQVLAAVRAQDYDQIDLLISDNGVNGEALYNLITQHYDKPFRFRRNTATVSISTHFNQLIEAAEGEYFILLADDDEISPNFVSTLVARMHNNPQVGVALARVETMDVDGQLQPAPARPLPPPLMSMVEFARAWGKDEYHFVSFATNLARTAEVRAAGGYLDFPSGNGNDNALLLKLCLGRSVAYCAEATFRYRVYETSTGLAASAATFAEASRQFLHFLEHDADLARYARSHPAEWAEIKRQLAQMSWGTYLSRWRTMYRKRMATQEWVRAGFALPWIPSYYRQVLGTLVYAVPPFAAMIGVVRRVLPHAQRPG